MVNGMDHPPLKSMEFDSIPWGAYLIAIIELAERFSTNFIQRDLPPGSRTGAGGLDGQSGALGMGQRASTGLGTFFQFWAYVTPLIGAYIADAHWGCFKTISWAICIAFLGHVILIISAIPGVIEKPGAIGAFCVALIVMGFGSGLFKANISPLVAEQYMRTKLFYFYLFINLGALIGQISMTYAEKFVGFYMAYTLPTIIFLLCPLVLYFGRNRYIRSPPTGSVLATSFRLLNLVKTYKNMTAPDFRDNAKPSRLYAEQRPAWMTFDDQWVDEVHRGLKACSVFCWYPLYWLTYNQLNNNLISQAATMSTHGVPNDILSNLDPFALIILIPVCDLIFYPALRRMGLNFSALKKITAGFMTGAAAMAWAAVTNPCHEHANTCEGVSPLNDWIQTGAYVLIAISEIFASITGLEYAFTKAPKNMRSLVMSVFLFMSAVASALGEAFVALSDDPLLVWNYGAMGVTAFVAGCIFWWSVRDLDAHEDDLYNLAEGHIQTYDEKHRRQQPANKLL
ncbi:peptide transporter PTR2A [Crassisporium funariophilum]|nr:peptide transporter PTR2A [Crassisporium funariophilum]